MKYPGPLWHSCNRHYKYTYKRSWYTNSREEKTKSLKDIKKEKKMTEVLKTAQIEPLTKSFVTQTGLETTKFCITIH